MHITVIIPYYNESETILSTLESLYIQTRKPEKIFLVDSGSTDDTSFKIKNWVQEKNTTYFEQLYSGKMSPSSSINMAIKKTNDDIIAYIDCGLTIPKDWLKTSEDLMISSESDIVSSSIFTKGVSLIDKSFIAQTYGIENNTICLPGSLIKKSVFNKIGYLIEAVRSGYDVDFTNKVKLNGLRRDINNKIELKYIGTNYTNSYMQGIKKVFSYSLAGWKTKKDIKPSLYFLLIILFFISISFNMHIDFIIVYCLLRMLLIPIYKSQICKTLLNPINYPFYLLSGIAIDLSRLSGYIYSLIYRGKYEGKYE